MKIPAVALVAAFGGGIVLRPATANRFTHTFATDFDAGNSGHCGRGVPGVDVAVTRAASGGGTLLVRLRYGERSLLLPGGAEKEEEYATLQEDGTAMNADVLKIGHPGAVRFERLEEAGMRVLRTDTGGALRVLTDGNKIWLNCSVECGE